MASIIFKDEKLTPGEKRVLRASKSKTKKGAKADPNLAGTRTASVLARAIAKMKRLRRAGEDVLDAKVKEKKRKASETAKPKAKPAKKSKSARSIEDRQTFERAGSVRRGNR
jgi:hypothetical protein